MFDASVVINLDKRPERFQRFMAAVRRVDWPFPEPVRFAAIDGTQHPPPAWWRCSPGSWGNLQSFLLIFEAAERDGLESLVIFEDDAMFPHDDLAARVRKFVEAVPEDWDQIYLGGGHHFRAVRQDEATAVEGPCLPVTIDGEVQLHFGLPVPVNDRVLRATCLFGAWATVWRRSAFSAMIDTINRFPDCVREKFFFPDRLTGTLHLQGVLTAYAPWKWIVHHRGGVSDSSGSVYEDGSFDLPDAVHDALWQEFHKHKEVSVR